MTVGSYHSNGIDEKIVLKYVQLIKVYVILYI
jgi:hypothetical protein